MSIQISTKKSRDGKKIWYYLEWGKGTGERKASGVFTYAKPKDQLQKNHNKEALSLLENKRSQLILDRQSIGTTYIPTHRFKDNFFDFYDEFVTNNKREGNRHLEGSLNQFRKFIGKDRLSPHDITENLSMRFRTYLLDRLTGKTPCDYFGAYKRVIKSATKQGYFRFNPAEDIRSKTNPSKSIREFLEADEYINLLKTPIINKELRDAFIVSCYSGLRWCDVHGMRWDDIKGEKLVTRIIQRKTGKPLELTLHPTVRAILEHKANQRRSQLQENERNNQLTGPVFHLPTHDGANKSIRKWVKRARIDKYITWHCARLSFSILLQDAKVDIATVALLMGHTTSRYVNEVYKRHRPKDTLEHLTKLPEVQWQPSMN